MDSAERTREMVREKYAAIAGERRARPSCCGSGIETESFTESGYRQLPGYAKDADLALGCGVPTVFASLSPGETVVDLGSGAGNDAFIAATAVGALGRVIGVDMTPAMITRARENAQKLGTTNVEFRLGEIETLPVETGIADVVISNCVLNLVPDKKRAFAEIHRILKPGGRFTVSDIVLESEIPEPLRRSAELWAGCVSGAILGDEYLRIAREVGFDLTLEKERPIDVPAEVIARAVPEATSPAAVRLLSVTLTGRKRRSSSSREDSDGTNH